MVRPVYYVEDGGSTYRIIPGELTELKELGLTGRSLTLFGGNCIEDCVMRMDAYRQFQEDAHSIRHIPVPCALADDPEMMVLKYYLASCSDVISNKAKTLNNFRRYWATMCTDPCPPLILVNAYTNDGKIDISAKRLPMEDIKSELSQCTAKVMEAKTSAKLGRSSPSYDEALVIFTSGTSSLPKGACITYTNLLYSIALLAYHMRLMDPKFGDLPVVLYACNPIYHVNSTAIFFMMIASPAQYNLKAGYICQRYNRRYYDNVAATITTDTRVVCPLVPKHIYFLESVTSDVKSKLGVAMGKNLYFFVGSSQISHSTFEEVRKLSSNRVPPFVRYGSTETSLQVMATPLDMDPDILSKIYQDGHEAMSYLIGCQPETLNIPEYQEALQLASIPYKWKIKHDKNDCSSSGQMFVAGGQVIGSYTNANIRDRQVHEGNVVWFNGLQDYCTSRNISGYNCVFWISRSHQLVKRNGVLYSSKFLEEAYMDALNLRDQRIDLALVKIPFTDRYKTILRDHPPCEDVLVLLHTITTENVEASLRTKNIFRLPTPDVYIPVMEIPRTFKGSLNRSGAVDVVQKYIEQKLYAGR